jgi:membrane fusion protein (multidrug efflux system)
MTDATFEALNDAPVATKARKAPFSRKTVLAVGTAVAAALVGGSLIAMPKSTVSTDAAYVQADSSSVAPKIRGLIAEVLVAHNQAVKKGDSLVRIDSEEFDARVASAEADLQDAEAALLAAHASLTSLSADEALAAATVRSARTSIASADAQNVRAQADRQRFDDLLASGTVARRDAEERRAAAVSAQSAADKTRADLDVTRNQATVVSARREVLNAGLARAGASVARARAALDLARQDQANTIIRAPIDGVVGDRQAEPGDYVQAGTRLLTIVPSTGLYVTANFKETQTPGCVVGQAADIEIDALPGTRCTGWSTVSLRARARPSPAAVRAGHGQFHQGGPARAGPHPPRPWPAGSGPVAAGTFDDGESPIEGVISAG